MVRCIYECNWYYFFMYCFVMEKMSYVDKLVYVVGIHVYVYIVGIHVYVYVVGIYVYVYVYM